MPVYKGTLHADLYKNVSKIYLGSTAIWPPVEPETETTALIARMSTFPGQARKSYINDLIVALKTAGVWSKLDVLYVYAAHTEQAALLNWIEDALNGTNTNSMVFTTDEGFKGGATNAYINTGINLGSPPTGLQFSYQDSHIGMYYFSLATSGTRDLRTDNNSIWFRSDISLPYGVMNAGTTFTQATKTAGSHHVAYVHNTSFRYVYREGSSANTQSAAGGGVSGNLTAGGRVDGTTNAEFSIFHMGAALTATEISDMYTAFNTYLTNIGTI